MRSLYVIGDSISVHYAPYLERCLHGFFRCVHREGEAEALNNLDLPMGANAGDSARVLDFLRGKRERGGIDADVLLLNCGLHDIRVDPACERRKTSLAGYADNLEAIVAEVAAMKPSLVWVRTTPCDEAVHNKSGAEFHRFGADVVTYNDVADAVMKKHGVPAIDLHTFTANLDASPSLYCDHVHFPVHIRREQAAFIAGWLMRF